MLAWVTGAGAVLCAGPLVVDGPQLVNEAGLTLLLDAAALAVAAVIGVLCLIKWRLLGQAYLLWLAAAAFTYGFITLGAGHVLPLVIAPGAPAEVIIWLHPASRLVAIGMLVAALAWPDVDASLRPRLVFGVALGMVAGVTLVFQLLPALGANLAGASDTLAAATAFPTGSAVIIVALLAAGAGFLRRAATLPRPLYSWFGVMHVSLALAEVNRVLPFTENGAWAAGDGALRLLGLIVGVAGVVGSMASDFGAQSGQLLASVTSGMTAEARVRAEQAAAEERAHEARNALAAIESATRTLEHYRDRIDPETRASLADAVSAEIARLQRLVSAETVASAAEEFSVDRALQSVLTAAWTQGIHLEVDIDPGAVAFGRGAETAEVVQNLIENARRYAPDSPITVRTSRDVDGVTIRVEDRGPGIPAEERRSIFARGYRGLSTRGVGGSGLGLYVSFQLMREQDGDLWVEARPGGGSSFALWLPSEPSATVDQRDDVGEVPDGDVGATARVGERPHAGGVGGVRDPDDDVRDEARG